MADPEAALAWLRARIDEDQAYASSALDAAQARHGAAVRDQTRDRYARILREVEAKRKILALYQDACAEDAPYDNTVAYLDAAVSALASVYSDREGYTERFGAESPWQQGQ